MPSRRAKKLADDQERSHGDRGVGDVERRPTKAAGVQLQKIGDAAVEQAIEQIARGAAGDQREPRLACACLPRARCQQPAKQQNDDREAARSAETETHCEADSENRPKAMPEFTLCTRAAKCGTIAPRSLPR